MSRFRQLPSVSPLVRFLAQHDDPLHRGFITRLDRSPVATKRILFFKALALNIIILLCLAALAAVTIVRDLYSPLPSQFRLAACITQDVIIGSAIMVLIRSTTIPFFLGECRLRIVHGFRPSEIVIRKPPIIPVMLNNSEDQRMERYWRIATRAVNPDLLYSNASAILSPEYWTLEYSAVFDAIRRIADGEFEENALEFAIWKQHNDIWNVCELWRMHEIMTNQQEVSMFRTFLTQSGKQELLAIWQDMLSCTLSGKVTERSPSPKAYQVMVDKFAREGLDYETVWSHVSEKSS